MTPYDRLHRIHVSAQALNAAMQSVRNPTLRDAWSGWLARFLPYYARYAGPESSELTRLKALFYSDDLERHVEEFRVQLEDFYRSVEREQVVTTSANGSAPLTRFRPTIANVGPQTEPGVPTWVWALGLGAVAAVVYSNARPRPRQRRATRRGPR